ncbi:MAG: hypothetical protein M1820_002653 [Bogoriella megaspora]|nr:MAG: hypothetical protein M1820_002653 [Bogoriella megaspora]
MAPTGFLSLPREIRDQIYRQALYSREGIHLVSGVSSCWPVLEHHTALLDDAVDYGLEEMRLPESGGNWRQATLAPGGNSSLFSRDQLLHRFTWRWNESEGKEVGLHTGIEQAGSAREEFYRKSTEGGELHPRENKLFMFRCKGFPSLLDNAILHVSRQVYLEALEALFRCNVFTFDAHPRIIAQSLRLWNPRCAMIQHVRFANKTVESSARRAGQFYNPWAKILRYLRCMQLKSVTIIVPHGHDTRSTPAPGPFMLTPPEAGYGSILVRRAAISGGPSSPWRESPCTGRMRHYAYSTLQCTQPTWSLKISLPYTKYAML